MYRIIHFRTYPLKKGDKIRIDDGPRRGDWLVIDSEPNRLRLRCPVSGQEVEWRNFCYRTEIREQENWPEP